METRAIDADEAVHGRDEGTGAQPGPSEFACVALCVGGYALPKRGGIACSVQDLAGQVPAQGRKRAAGNQESSCCEIRWDGWSGPVVCESQPCRRNLVVAHCLEARQG